jgi:hypothetical protein
MGSGERVGVRGRRRAGSCSLLAAAAAAGWFAWVGEWERRVVWGSNPTSSAFDRSASVLQGLPPLAFALLCLCERCDGSEERGGGRGAAPRCGAD